MAESSLVLVQSRDVDHLALGLDGAALVLRALRRQRRHAERGRLRRSAGGRDERTCSAIVPE